MNGDVGRFADVNSTVLAYAAGLIDGEGCITLNRWIDKRYQSTVPRFKYSLRVVVAMTEPDSVKFLHLHLGGMLRVYSGRNSTRKNVYIWSLSCHAGSQFLRASRHLLLVKRKQADAAIKYAEWITAQTPVGARGYSDAQNEIRDKAYQELRELKHMPQLALKLALKELDDRPPEGQG